MAIFFNDQSIEVTTIKKDPDGRNIAIDISIQSTIFHLTNIYAPVGNRTTKNTFFDNLYSYTFSDLPTIIAGDFNVVDEPTIDRFPPGNNSEKNKTLQSLCSTLGLTDAYRDLYGERRTFTRRQGITQSRIDRFYISKDIHPTNQSTKPSILSDHDIIILHVKNIKKAQRGKGIWMNNTKVYDTPPFQQELSERWTKWQTLHLTLFIRKSDWWIHIKSRIKDINQKYARRQADKGKKEDKDLEKEFKEVWANLPEKPELLPKYHSIKRQLLKTQLQRTKESIYKEQAIAKGNLALGSKEFFEQFTEKRTNTRIEAISDPQGKLLTETDDILKTVQAFYQRLYSKKTNDPEAANHFWNQLQQHNEIDKTFISKPISKKELHEIIKTIVTGKSPGPDGISVEFGKRHWQTIKQDFTEMINKIHDSHKFPEMMKHGIIKLIHKKGLKTDIRNYRPITLLNVDLKIYTKCLMKRIAPAMKDLLSQHQYAAPGKKIQQAAGLARDLYEHANKKKMDAFFIALDFQKAFDSVNQDFVQKTLSKFGLPKQFTQIVQSMNTNTKSQLLINGHLTRPITIESGVRQGDPLSMYLFLIAAEPLAIAIRNNNKIQGI